MIIDGRSIAEDIYTSLRTRRGAHANAIKLGIIVGNRDPVIESFVGIKSKVAADLGIEIVRVDLPEDAGTETAMMAVRDISAHVDAIIVQLPLRAGIDTNAVLTEIPRIKDVDGINPIVGDNERYVRPPVAGAVLEILNRAGVSPRGMRAVVVGAGRLVGTPVVSLLKDQGAHVSVVTLYEGDIADIKDADIVMLGAGNPGFIKPEHLKEGVVLIDAGTSESSGVIRGDADPSCAEKASVFTPVPGGVGPIAVAMIFKNILDLLDKNRS